MATKTVFVQALSRDGSYEPSLITDLTSQYEEQGWRVRQIVHLLAPVTSTLSLSPNV